MMGSGRIKTKQENLVSRSQVGSTRLVPDKEWGADDDSWCAIIRPVSYVQEALWEGAGRERKLATHTSSDAKLQASYMGGRLV